MRCGTMAIQDHGNGNGLEQLRTYAAVNHVFECSSICHLLAKPVSVTESPIDHVFVVHAVHIVK